MNKKTNKKNKGSVLIVVVGVLALLAMMAGAFVSTMTMQKAVGKNVKTDIQAELVTQSGLAHALAVITDHYKNDPDPTNLTQPWFTTFSKPKNTITNSNEGCSDLLATSEGATKNDGFSATPNDDDWPNTDPFPDKNNAAEPYDGYTKWFMVDTGEVYNNAGDKYIARYSVLTLDLMGRVSTKGDNGTTATYSPIFSTVVNGGIENDYTKKVFNNAITLMHAQRIYDIEIDTATPGKLLDDFDFLNMINPYGEVARDTLGAGHSTDICAININTAPKIIRNGLVCAAINAAKPSLSGNANANYHNLGTGIGVDVAYNDIHGVEKASANSFEADIARSLEVALNAVDVAPFKYTNTNDIEKAFLNDLNPKVEILKIYNDEWEESGGFYQPKNYGGGKGDKSKQMEKAVNDVLNSLFNADGAATSDNVSTTIPGLYANDFDGDLFVKNTTPKFSWDKTTFSPALQLFATFKSNLTIGEMYHTDAAITGDPSNTTGAHPNLEVGQSTAMAEGTNELKRAWTKTPEIFIGKSSYYRIIVRGQVGKTDNGTLSGTWNKTIAEKNLEAVVYVYKHSSGAILTKTLYKRWFTR